MNLSYRFMLWSSMKRHFCKAFSVLFTLPHSCRSGCQQLALNRGHSGKGLCREESRQAQSAEVAPTAGDTASHFLDWDLASDCKPSVFLRSNHAAAETTTQRAAEGPWSTSRDPSLGCHLDDSLPGGGRGVRYLVHLPHSPCPVQTGLLGEWGTGHLETFAFPQEGCWLLLEHGPLH